MGLFGYKSGDKVVFKSNQQEAMVRDISYQKVFVETVSKRSGQKQEMWVDKSSIRKARGN